MAATVRPVEYYNATVVDRPGAAHTVLTHIAAAGVNLLAFSAVPCGPAHAQLVLFPEDGNLLEQVARELGMTLTGPQHAILVQGDDELGALAGIHERLAVASVDVYAANGVTDGRGGFGYVLYVRPHDFAAAARTLGL